MVGDNHSRIPEGVRPWIFLGGLYYMLMVVVVMKVMVMMNMLVRRSLVK